MKLLSNYLLLRFQKHGDNSLKKYHMSYFCISTALPSKLSHLEGKIASVKSCLRDQITASFPVCFNIARNLGQNGGRGSRVTFKIAPKQNKKMYGKRLFFFFQNSCLGMGYSFAA